MAWTEQEMKEGFLPATEDKKDYEIASDGKPIRFSNKPSPNGGVVYAYPIPVMDRDLERADTTITVGNWELRYDSHGYCYMRKKLKK